MYAEQKWPRLPRYFEASTFDAFRILSSKLKISNVRELGHEFSHSLDPKATAGTVRFRAAKLAIGHCSRQGSDLAGALLVLV